MVQENSFKPQRGLGCCPSKAVVLLLLLIYCLKYFPFLWGFCVCLSLFMHYFVSFLVLQSSL